MMSQYERDQALTGAGCLLLVVAAVVVAGGLILLGMFIAGWPYQ